MKKLNKVAMLFASAALASAAGAQTVDNWRNGTSELVWKNGTNELCWRDANWTPATAAANSVINAWSVGEISEGSSARLSGFGVSGAVIRHGLRRSSCVNCNNRVKRVTCACASSVYCGCDCSSAKMRVISSGSFV